MKKTCEECHAEFEPKDHPERCRFCSQRCAGLHAARARRLDLLAARPHFLCQSCGAQFQSKEGPAHTRQNPPKYCSLACRDKSRTTRVTLVCRQCKQPFERKAYMAAWSNTRGPFCSSECYGDWQSGKRPIFAAVPSKTGPAWDRARRAALERDGYRCALCGSDQHVEVHHVVPWKLGDAHLLDNLQTQCRPCHHTRHQKHGRRAKVRP